MSFSHLFSSSVPSIFASKLLLEIQQSGHNADGLADLLSIGQVRIDFIDAPPDAAEQAAVQAIIDVHDSTDYEQIRRDNSINQVGAISNWATWTEVEGLVWHDGNIKDPLGTLPDIDGLTPAQFQNNVQEIMAVMQDVLSKIEDENRAIVRIVLALRNKVWSSLEGS